VRRDETWCWEGINYFHIKRKNRIRKKRGGGHLLWLALKGKETGRESDNRQGRPAAGKKEGKKSGKIPGWEQGRCRRPTRGVETTWSFV